MTDSKSPTPPSAGSGAATPINAPVAHCPVGCPGAVKFNEHGKKWGWDDYTVPDVPWISVERGKSDTVEVVAAAATDAGKMCNVTYTSSDITIADVSPKSGTADHQILTIDGKKKGEATVTATCGGSELGKFKVAVKDLMKKKVVMRVIDETNYASTDVSQSAVQDFFTKVYKQAVVEITVTKVAKKTVAFDLDGSGDLMVADAADPTKSIAWPGSEVQKIVDKAGDSSYDFNVFFVDKPNDGSTGWSGFGNTQKSGVIHADNSSKPESTAAHEMGHGLFSLQHTLPDTDNIMYNYNSNTKWRLRKGQWDQINP